MTTTDADLDNEVFCHTMTCRLLLEMARLVEQLSALTGVDGVTRIRAEALVDVAREHSHNMGVDR